jgi:hypothetical protein
MLGSWYKYSWRVGGRRDLKAPILIVFSFLALSGIVDDARAQQNDSGENSTPISPGLHARLFDTHLKNLSDKCSGEEQKLVCIDEVWKIADVSNDKELSVAEITRMLRIISGKVAYQEYVEDFEKFQSRRSKMKNESPPESQEAVVVLGVATVGPIVSHALIGNFDYNDNGRLSKEEILYDFVEDISLDTVDSLPSEIRSRASNAVEQLLKFFMKK